MITYSVLQVMAVSIKRPCAGVTGLIVLNDEHCAFQKEGVLKLLLGVS